MRQAYHLALADAQKVLDKRVGVKMVPLFARALEVLEVLEDLGFASLDCDVSEGLEAGHFRFLNRQSLPRKLCLCCYPDPQIDSYAVVAVPTALQMPPSSYPVSVSRRHELRASLQRMV